MPKTAASALADIQKMVSRLKKRAAVLHKEAADIELLAVELEATVGQTNENIRAFRNNVAKKPIKSGRPQNAQLPSGDGA